MASETRERGDMTERHLTEGETPERMMMGALVMGSRAIEAQEKRGQSKLTASSVLPVKINSGGDRSVLEAWGIVFHDDDADDLFVPVDLPEGWTVEATDHAMWSKLLDDQGRERASIFYKAAFYDRDAFINIGTRYRVRTDYPEGYTGGDPITAVVEDAGKVIHRTEAFEDGKSYENSDRARLAAFAWVDEHYPDWRDPLAYWEAT